MSTEERLEVMRQRLAVLGWNATLKAARQAQHMGVWGAKHRELMRSIPKSVRYVLLPKPTGRGFVSLGPMQPGKVVQVWVKIADELPERPIGTRNRRKGKAALTVIGEKVRIEKLPKLPRKYAWQCDDASEASRNEP